MQNGEYSKVKNARNKRFIYTMYLKTLEVSDKDFLMTSYGLIFTHLYLVNKKINNWAEFVCADHVTTIVQTITTSKSQHIGDTTKSSDKTKQQKQLKDLTSELQICPYNDKGTKKKIISHSLE